MNFHAHSEPAAAKRGEIIEIGTLIAHAMETGFRRTYRRSALIAAVDDTVPSAIMVYIHDYTRRLP